MTGKLMKTLAPNPELERLLKEAKARGPMTREEMFEQKVSWVYGEMRLAGHDVTKDEVRQRLEANR